MGDIIKEISKELPSSYYKEIIFEGANIVVYTTDKDFFLDNNKIIKKIVNDIKKRVELRADPSILLDENETKKIINEILPQEAGISDIFFDKSRSLVIIEAEKPGVAIGKKGILLREIKEKTLWTPLIRRKPAIKSKIMDNIRSVLYNNSDYRKKFLNLVGHRIYDGWRRGRTKEWVRVSFLGSAREVGRSCILLQTQESRVLLDCGLDPASDNYPYLDAPEFDINELDAIIITHSHLDHIGLVPYLFRKGYRGPVYCTEPTRDIGALILLDAIKVAHAQAEDSLFSVDDIKEMVKHTITLDYEEVTDITPDLRITLYNAGHILGSSMVHIHIGNGLHNMLYTGDIKYARTKLLEPSATNFPRLETVIIESTYGGKDSKSVSRKESEEEFKNAIKKTIKRKGKVLVPVLGSGRAQEIMLIVEEMIRKEEIPKIDVYVDGMVWDITAIHTAYPEFMNKYIRNQIFQKNTNPFLSDIFKRVGSNKERLQIVEEKGPCIILATSGMLVGGPSVEYLKHLSQYKKNSIVFVSYQGEGSLGRRILQGEKEFNLGSTTKPDIIKVNMEIYNIEGFSGHSTRSELLNFISSCRPRPRKVIVNHGDASNCVDLANTIHKRNRMDTAAPKNLEAIRLK